LFISFEINEVQLVHKAMTRFSAIAPTAVPRNPQLPHFSAIGNCDPTKKTSHAGVQIAGEITSAAKFVIAHLAHPLEITMVGEKKNKLSPRFRRLRPDIAAVARSA